MKNSVYFFIIFLALTSCKQPTKYKNLNEGLYAEIQTNKGDILLELYADDVPMTVANFVSLAEGTNPKMADSIKGNKFYDGIRFHRVVNTFIIQAGDPTETGRGSAGYKFGDEFPKDEDGLLLYEHDDQGILSMANSGPDSNGSQIFITHREIPHLDNKHSVFGKTIINSDQLLALKQQVKDSTKLQNSIDSLRMVVVNKIKELDTIHTVKIIRIGDKAKNFNAAKVFEENLVAHADNLKNKEQQEAEEEIARYAKFLEDKKEFLIKMDEPKAVKTESGLRILKLKSNPSGKKVVTNKPIKSNFVLYTADGRKIQDTKDSGQPFVFQLDDEQRPMITGFKEGVAKLKEGEKVRLFVPYYIGFGEAKYGPFPAKSDLVFEIEILEIGE